MRASKEVAGGAFLGGGEVLHGFELEFELVVRAALVGIEDQRVGAHPERFGQFPQRLERRLGRAGLVAVDLDQGDAGDVGQGLLGEAPGLAELGQPLGEGHGVPDTAVDYDPAGRPLQVVVGGLSSTYEYNVLGELKARTGTIGNPEAYTYDAGGNRRTDLMTTYTYNNRDQLTGSNSTACGPATYHYDASGNLWRQTPAIYCSAVEYREMLYDGLNRLTWSQTQKSVPGGIQTETRDFWYDALGRRILAMTVDSGGEGEPPRDWGVWRYWWLDNHVAVKTHNHQALPDWNWPSVQRVSGTLTSMGTWYIYGPGMDNPLASWGYTSSGGGYSDTTQHLFFQDWRGSVTEVRGANGQNLGWGANDFTAYGAGGGGGDLGVAPGYNGLESNGGLVYMRNRWYDPNAGRFTQEDPIGYAGGINLYGFVGNNPVMFRDPFGLDRCSDLRGKITKKYKAFKKEWNKYWDWHSKGMSNPGHAEKVQNLKNGFDNAVEEYENDDDDCPEGPGHQEFAPELDRMQHHVSAPIPPPQMPRTIGWHERTRDWIDERITDLGKFLEKLGDPSPALAPVPTLAPIPIGW